MFVLLSIRPKYVESIFSGKKRYEFRKKIRRDAEGSKAFIYESKAARQIVGYFIIEKILSASPEAIWKECNKYGGISKEEFFEYFEGCTTAYAIKIRDIHQCNPPIDPYFIEKSFKPPQSLCYIYDKLLKHILSCSETSNMRKKSSSSLSLKTK